VKGVHTRLNELMERINADLFKDPQHRMRETLSINIFNLNLKDKG
jgi:hypothetical protein